MRRHSMHIVLPLILFCIFTISVLMVLMTGAGSYQRVTASMQQSYEERICLQYITSKIRHYSGENAVSVSQFGDGDCLELREQIGGQDYVTYIYLYDGMVKELFCESGSSLGPEAGFDVMAVQKLSVDIIDAGLLRIECTGVSGGSAETLISVRGEMAVTGGLTGERGGTA